MRINHFELAGLKRFDFSRIKKLTADIRNNIQVVIGRTGSAKSSTLAELNPLSLNKQSFYKGGYKRIDIEHRGDTYSLVGDYSAKSKTYSFIKNGEDLNLGGTSQVQSELIIRHLGYTTLIRDILYSNVKMCNLTKAERKDLLFSINPVDLSLVVEKHRQMTQEIRKDKTNLTMLYNRKDELLSKILPEDVLKDKYQQKAELEKKIQEYSKDEYVLHHHLELLNTASSTQKVYDSTLDQIWDVIRDTDSDIHPHKRIYSILGMDKLERNISLFGLQAYKCINKDDAHSEEMRLQTEYRLLEQKSEDIRKHLATLMHDLDESTRYLKDIERSNDVNVLEQTLKEYQQEYELLCKTVPDEKVQIPKNTYDTIRDHFLPELEYNIRSFISLLGTRKRICTFDTLHMCERKLANLDGKRFTLVCAIDTNNKNIEKINNELSVLPSEPEVVLENCKLCDYRQSYIVQVENLKRTKKELECELAKLHPKKDRLCKAIEALSAYRKEQSDILKCIEHIHNLLEASPFAIGISSLTMRLVDNPILFLNTITNIVKVYPDIYRKHELRESIDKLNNQLSAMQKANLPSLEFVQSLISKYNQEIAHGRIELSNITKDKEGVTGQLHLYSTYAGLQKECLCIDDILRQAYEYVLIKASKEFYTNALNTLLSSKNSVIFQLRDIEETLKNQELLLSRLNDEVVAQITKIEKHKALCEDLEYALSPSTGFIHKNMVEHLNTLINNVNCILDGMCSYSLQLVPLKEDDPLDYAFRVRVEDVEDDDISQLSTGQKVMVSLAFTISFMLSLGITDYPLILDEVIMGLDTTNVQKVLEYLKFAVDNKYISQIFFVNHDAIISSGFEDSDTICLSPLDIAVSDNANQYVTLETF